MGEKCRSRTVSGGFKSGLSAWAGALLSVSGSFAATPIVGFFCFSRRETFQRAPNGEFVAIATTIPVAKLRRKSPVRWMPSIQISTCPVRVS